MPQPLRVLIIEDNPHDAELVIRGLRRAGFEPEAQVVDTEPAYLAQLDRPLDLILSDYALPQFNGLRALELKQARGLTTPFILVSATIGEETAVAAIHLGAADYLIKDRLHRLGPAVERALREARLEEDRRRAESALGLFRSLVDQSGDTLEIIDPVTARVVDVNGHGPAELGCTREEYLALHAYDLDPTLTAATWPALAARIRAAGALAGEGFHRRKDGSVFPIEFHARWVRQYGRDYIVTVVRDVALRREAEQSLRESEQRFRQVMENIQEVFWMSDVAKKRILYVSPRFEVIWGRRCEELYASMEAWSGSIHEEDRGRVHEAALTKQALGTYDETYRVVRPDGTVRWVHDKAFPVREADGTVTRVVGVAEDITDHHQLEEQFLRTQRVEAIGTLAGGIAHDLNNILAPMLMVAPLLREKLTDDRDHELLAMVEKGAQRGANIIKQLLTFSRGVEDERGPIQARHLLKEMASIMHETFPREITVQEQIPPELWPVTADATQLHQVLMNLCVNARDAMPAGGKLVLAARNTTLAEDDPALQPGAKPGPYMCLSVSDTGDGIPPENLGRIFEPFFTTKAIGKGTGLGLSTVMGIVKNHHGFVSVQSTQGIGTTFSVFLPACREMLEPAPHSAVTPKPGRQELILVVDDEMAIRYALRHSLESNNYRVLLAADGREAANLFLAHRESVRLLLTDIMMPGMNGVALIRALRTLAPALPVVAMSGLHDQGRHDELVALRVTEIVAKPYGHTEIMDTVQRALTGGGPLQSGRG